jgi:hypothetical protein
MADEPTDDVLEIDLAETLGVSGVTSAEMLTLYIPNKDKHGREFGTQRKWVLRAAELLANIGGGVTIEALVKSPDVESVVSSPHDSGQFLMLERVSACGYLAYD